MADNRSNLKIAGIEIILGWFMLGVAAFLHLSFRMNYNEYTTILIPAILGIALFKILIDSISDKLIKTANILIKNVITLLFAVAISAGTVFILVNNIVQLPYFISSRLPVLCSILYTCIIYYSGRKNGILRHRFYGYLTLILLIILNFRIQQPLNRAIILLITVGFANLLLPIVAIIKSEKRLDS